MDKHLPQEIHPTEKTMQKFRPKTDESQNLPSDRANKRFRVLQRKADAPRLVPNGIRIKNIRLKPNHSNWQLQKIYNYFKMPQNQPTKKTTNIPMLDRCPLK